MASLTIDLTSEMEARLKEVAERQGIVLPELVRNALEALAAPEVMPAANGHPGEKSLWEKIDDLIAEVPEEEIARLPADGSEQHDHYIYGTPKRKR